MGLRGSSPDGADVRKVISNGRLRWRGNLIFVNSALTGEYVSVIEREDEHYEFRFGPICLGIFDPKRPSLGLVYEG
jgi:hypothetical protein